MTAPKTNIEKISDQVKVFTSEEIAIIKATVAKGFTDTELAYFLNVAKIYGLNPFTKQIWAYKDLKDNIIVFAGRDGFLAKAQKDKRWNGMSSDVVRVGEEFEMDAGNGTIKHRKQIDSLGELLGAYAISRPKGCEFTTIEWADFSTYDRNHGVWKSDPVAMIKKVAESHCLAKAYGISGLAIEEDFDIKGESAITRDHEQKPSPKEVGYADCLVQTSTYDEDQRCVIEDKIYSQSLTTLELDTIIADLKNNQPKKF